VFKSAKLDHSFAPSAGKIDTITGVHGCFKMGDCRRMPVVAGGVRIAISFVTVLGLASAYAGCSARRDDTGSAPPSVKMQARFDYSEHEPFAQKGQNRITGIGFLNSEAAIGTCAGSRVLLLPGTPYFREMIAHIVAGSEPAPPDTPFPSLKDMIRRTECDAQGSFSFSEIPDGEWFILTEVNVRTGGGVMIGKLTLSHAEMTRVLLTEKHLVGR
jgi:hypothetical protein